MRKLRRQRIASEALVVIAAIGVIFALLGGVWLAASATADAIRENGGLKPIVEQLWCGERGCFDGEDEEG